MKYQMIYEMNHTYMVVSGEEIEQGEDYRYRMLSSNMIKGLLPLEVRRINNEKRLFIDLTGKETFLSCYNSRKITRDEIKRLLEAVYLISDEMERYLIGETDISLSPEMILRNMTTNQYEFVCIPLVENEEVKNEGLSALMHFLMMHIDNDDEELVEAVYSISDMYETGIQKISEVYEYFVEKTGSKEELKEVIAEERIEITSKRKRYHPSAKEWGTLGVGIAGLILITVNIYLSFI